MGSAQNPALAKRARALTLDPKLRANELMVPLWAQLAYPDTQEDAWSWLKANYEALVQRLGVRSAQRLVFFARRFCDEEHAADAQAFFGPRVEKLEGGPRGLALALEDVRLCTALRAAQTASARQLVTKP